jgi:hypothetical protein
MLYVQKPKVVMVQGPCGRRPSRYAEVMIVEKLGLRSRGLSYGSLGLFCILNDSTQRNLGYHMILSACSYLYPWKVSTLVDCTTIAVLGVGDYDSFDYRHARWKPVQKQDYRNHDLFKQ